MNDKKNRKSVDASQVMMSPVQAIYIAALGAARADGHVDEAETLGLKAIASLQGQEQELDYALSYYESLKDSENAINGALSVVKEAGESTKLAAIVFMKYILEKSGESEEESNFFENAIKQLN